MRGDAVTLGDLIGKIMLLEIAYRRCERRGRLRIDRLIEQYGDMRLPELRLILPSDCPRAGTSSISDRCSVFFPQLLVPQGG